MRNTHHITAKKNVQFVVGVLVAITLAATTANAATVLQVDFDSLTPGAVTAGTLDGVTTGGSWVLNTDDATHSIEDDTSAFDDYAYLSTATAANEWGAQVVLDTPVDIDVDLSTGDLMIDFETATLNSTGFSRDAFWRFYDGVTLLATIEMDDGTVFLNASNLGSLTGSADANRVKPWDSTSAQVFTVDIDIDSSGNFDLIMSRDGGSSSVSGSTTISSTANFDRIETGWANIGGPMGVYLNDITIETPAASSIPEPATFTLAALGILGFCCTRRRRRK